MEQVMRHEGQRAVRAVAEALAETDLASGLALPPLSAVAEHEVALSALGESLGALRLCGSESVRQMRQSLAEHGQLTPLAVCVSGEEQLAVIDGFKRVRAARDLGWRVVRVRRLGLNAVQAKAAVVALNTGRLLTELEEAWVVRSLYREDGLRQPAIGRLLGRHKSWVCRRLALAEGLDAAVEADVRLGLLAARAAYEVTRLPRGNQREVAEVVVRRGLTVGQTARLCTALLACTDEAARQALLRAAQEGPGMPPARAPRRAPSPAEQLVADAGAVTRIIARLQARLLATPLAALGAAAAAHVSHTLAALTPALAALSRTIAEAQGARHADVA